MKAKLYVQGRSQDLAGGGGKKLFPDLEICMSQSALLEGSGACPPEIFFKWCNLCIFGSDFVFEKFQKLPFFIQFFLKYYFLYKNNVHFRYTLAME